MLNQITIMGRLTRTPETRYTRTNIPVTSFTVACQRDYAGSEGGKPKTDFINCEAWRSTAEFVGKYFETGSMIVVQGRLAMDEWQDNDGKRRVTAKVVAEHVYFGESRRAASVPSPDISAADFEELPDDGEASLPF